MIRHLIPLLFLVFLASLADPSFASESNDALSPALLSESIRSTLSYFQREQKEDGSWTAPVQVSSVMYNTQTIFLYEYLGLLQDKADRASELMRFVWARQNDDGGFNSYEGAPSSLSMSTMVILAAKIMHEDEAETRMQKLEKFVETAKNEDGPSLGEPYLLLFGVQPEGSCVNDVFESLLLRLQSRLPWIRAALYPMVHLYANGGIHPLSGVSFPKKLEKGIACPGWISGIAKKILHLNSEKSFWKWLSENLNDDGTLFDYAPTTIPALMALSRGGPKYEKILEKGLASIETLQVKTEDGLYQAPGEGSVGETNAILNGLMEMGLTPQDPMVERAGDFIRAMQQPGSGGFGFSKHNQHFPDSDDTSNSIYNLDRVSHMNGRAFDQADESRALKWLLNTQNHDGGFGTWEKERFLAPIEHLMHKTGVVLAESVIEHTARIVVALSAIQNNFPEVQRPYRRAVDYLLKEQNENGSYSGTWFVDYQFGTAMALTALSTDSKNPRVKTAIQKALSFVLSTQRNDGSFSESPTSFILGKSVPLSVGSPAQTGLVISQLLTFLKIENGEYTATLREPIEKAIRFLLATQKADGLWHDLTWTGVTFPKVEYLIYPYIQEFAPVQALGMYLRWVNASN